LTSIKVATSSKADIPERLVPGRLEVGNRLLGGLSQSDYDQVRAHLTHVPLSQHQPLLSPTAPTNYVYFFESGMVSLVLTLEDGNTVEVGLVGRQGIVGVLAGLGASRISGEAMVQMPGSAWRMETDMLRKEIAVIPTFQQMLLRYVQALFAQVTQSTACNMRHALPQRLARWLLMANDCAETNEVRLTHEFLSMMLGVRRSVTTALKGLSDLGIVAASRGRILILDRKRLEAAACECYRTVRAEYERLLGSVGRF
jgi:CRP-like cAMP-binding protein